MKKFISLILILMTMFTLFACGNTEKKSNTFLVGFGREKINPDVPVYLSGGGNPNRISTGFIDYLYVTCIAFTDANDNTVLVFTQDLQNTADSFTIPARSKVSQATGVPEENIMMSSTHTHSAPGLISPTYTGIDNALEIYYKAVVRAAQSAMADRAAAEISIGTAQTENMTFVRHYKLDNGTYAGANFGDFNSGQVVEHAGNNDGEIQLIKFTRSAENKKDILLMSFGTHPTFNGSTSLFNLSADFPSPTRDYIESKEDCYVAYFTGSAGNQGPSTKIESEMHDALNDYRAYGQKLGQYVLDALPSLVTAESGVVSIKGTEIILPTNKADLEKINEATETYNAYLEGGYTLSDPLVEKYGFERVFEARAIVTRAALPETIKLSINALSIGDVSFIFAPYEMFSDNGMYIKANTPFDMTFVVTMANGHHGYIPSKEGCAFRSYEVYSTNFELGSAEVLADAFMTLLSELDKS